MNDGNPTVKRFLVRAGVFALGALGWFLAALAGELIGNQANATEVGQQVGWYLLIVGIGVMPLIALGWAVIKLVGILRRKSLPPPPPDPIPPSEPDLPWWRPPDPVFDREVEVATVVRKLLDTGVAVVCGARDVGTSAVAEAAVQSLIDEGRVEDRHVVRLDLRSRSSRAPDDARATAARILSMFRQDEPANDSPEVLANAAARLHDVLAKRYSVLLLDNVTTRDEIDWLLPQWTGRNNQRPWLVIAGEMAIGAAVPDSSRVRVAPLSADGMRKIWHADTDTRPEEPPRPLPDRRWSLVQRLLDAFRPRPNGTRPTQPSTPDPIDKLIAACGGRPHAIKAVARETKGDDRDAEVAKLLESLHSDDHNPLVGIWQAILARTEVSLMPEAAWLLHALAALPVTALTGDAIRALVSASGADAGAGDSLPAPFEELRVRGFVQEVGDRYRLPQEIRWAITGRSPGKNVEIARVAVPALVRHHADRVVRRANQLDVRSVGARAAAWLHEEEPSLRALFAADHYEDGKVLLAVIDDLARIASALEYWYVREQQADGLLKVSKEFGELADRAERPELSALAAARRATAHRMLGHEDRAREELALVAGEARAATADDLAPELVTRVRVEKSLLGMTAPGAPTHAAERDKVRQELEEIAERKRHPGAGIAMLNLGALHLADNAPEEALRRLEEAEAMARERRDVGCQAQAVELRGIALSATDLPAAVSLWQEARQLFAAIGEEQGEARCLQHLGAAGLADPAAAGYTREKAAGYLEKAKQLRAGQPDTALVDEYLRTAVDEQGPDKPATAPTS